MDRSIVICLACVFLLGCDRHSETQRRTSLAGDDNSVLDIVLSDLSTYNGPGRPFSLLPQTPREIYFLRKAIAWQPDATKPLHHDGVFATLNTTERNAVGAAIEDLTRRNETEYAFQRFQPTTKVIHVIDDVPQPLAESQAEVPYSSSFPIQCWSPGYSADESYVVVHLHFSELLHPSAATYVLNRGKDGWTIKYRGFITWI